MKNNFKILFLALSVTLVTKLPFPYGSLKNQFEKGLLGNKNGSYRN